MVRVRSACDVCHNMCMGYLCLDFSRLLRVQAHPLSEVEPQMSDWNGGIGAKQLK